MAYLTEEQLSRWSQEGVDPEIKADLSSLYPINNKGSQEIHRVKDNTDAPVEIKNDVSIKVMKPDVTEYRRNLKLNDIKNQEKKDPVIEDSSIDSEDGFELIN